MLLPQQALLELQQAPGPLLGPLQPLLAPKEPLLGPNMKRKFKGCPGPGPGPGRLGGNKNSRPPGPGNEN